MVFCVNPGSGPVSEGCWEMAYANIQQFIQDCEIPMYIKEACMIPDEDSGRYLFKLDAVDFSYPLEIEMPGLPLDKVRYMGEEGQNPFRFPRLYVDGASWLWKFAVVTKEEVVNSLRNKIKDAEAEIRKLEELIEQVQDGGGTAEGTETGTNI